MFDTSLAIPLHFTVEFLGFLVTAAAGVLVLARRDLVPGSTSNRVAAALGFAAIAAAQVMHGAAFIESDGARVLVAMKTLGFALVLIGVVGALRVSPAAIVPLDDAIAFAPAGAAILVALMALPASRTGPKALRRLSLAAFLLAVGAVLLAFAPQDASVGAGRIDPYLFAAHVVDLLGFFVLAGWVWTGVRSSIGTRFVASFVALLVLVVLVLSTALTAVIGEQVRASELQRVKSQVRNVVQTIEQDAANDLFRQAKIANNTQLQERMASGSGLDTLAKAFIRTNLRNVFSFDFVIFMPNRGGVAFFGRKPSTRIDARGDPVPAGRLRERQLVTIIGSDVVATVVNRGLREATSVDQVGDAVAVIAAVSVDDPGPGRREVGTAVFGQWVDAFTIDEVTESLRPAKASLFVEDELFASSLPRRVTTDEELLTRPIENRLSAGDVVGLEQDFEDASYFTAFAPLNASGQGYIDASLALSSPGRVATAAREGLTRILFLVAIGAAAIVLALAYLSGRRIARPIQRLTLTASAVREGDLSAQADVGGDDEVGQLGETFNEMTMALNRMTNDLREAAREEHRLRARIETIIASMADALVAVDASGKVLAFNPEAEHLTGIGADEALGKPVRDVLDARDSHGERVDLPIFNLDEGSVSGIFVRRNGDDRVPIAATSAVLRGEDDEIAGGVAVLRDMSREREIERMKSEFLSNISHELRTPLTPIKGYAEILGRKQVSREKTQQFVRGILDSTARLERIVELLVDFSAMEAGKLAPSISTVDLAAVVNDLASEWGKRAPQHTVVADVGERLPKVVGDERLLRRSLEEVLDNAVKFSPSGGTIRVEAKPAGNGRSPDRDVLVVVSDEGIGIAPDDLPHIFSDFHQLDGSETRAYGGLGLGLAFVQRIVEAHHGSVSVESEPDHGTRLTIAIPAARNLAGE